MNLQTAIPEILSVINNRSKTTSAFEWIKATLYDIKSLGRFDFLYKEKQIDFSTQISLPSDCDEIIEPIFLDQNLASVGTSWIDLTTEWDYDNSVALRMQPGEYGIIGESTILFPDEAYSGVIMLPYYRNITIPTSIDSTDELDIPDEVAYQILVYGSAVHGLLLEDDYDRMNFAREQYNDAIGRLTSKDGRGKIANMRSGLTGGNGANRSNGNFPGNYAVEID